MLDFQPVTLEMKAIVDRYTFQYGENSCQHSFVSSFCLFPKYGDNFCERDGVLYTLRSKKCTKNERVYLFPHGESEKIPRALQNIFDDAREHNSAVKFETVTERAKDIITKLFPEKFSVEYNRDYAEYVYSIESLKDFSGSELSHKRRDFQRFLRDYEGRFQVKKISPDDIEKISVFQSEWLAAKLFGDDDFQHEAQISRENDAIKIAFENYAALNLTGIMILIDGKIKGYAYGAKLSKNCVDEIIEKGDRNITNIYPFIRHEFARVCGAGCEYLNLEEDIGVAGLRTAKTHYKPEFLIEKYILREAL